MHYLIFKNRIIIDGYSKNEYIFVSNSDTKLRIEYELYKNNTYIDGDRVGSVIVYLDDEVLRKEGIYVMVQEKTEKLSWWERLLRWIKW